MDANKLRINIGNIQKKKERKSSPRVQKKVFDIRTPTLTKIVEE